MDGGVFLISALVLSRIKDAILFDTIITCFTVSGFLFFGLGLDEHNLSTGEIACLSLLLSLLFFILSLNKVVTFLSIISFQISLFIALHQLDYQGIEFIISCLLVWMGILYLTFGEASFLKHPSKKDKPFTPILLAFAVFGYGLFIFENMEETRSFYFYLAMLIINLSAATLLFYKWSKIYHFSKSAIPWILLALIYTIGILSYTAPYFLAVLILLSIAYYLNILTFQILAVIAFLTAVFTFFSNLEYRYLDNYIVFLAIGILLTLAAFLSSKVLDSEKSKHL